MQLHPLRKLLRTPSVRQRIDSLGDAQLVAGVVAGDEESLGEIWQRHCRAVHAAAQPLCGTEAADDVVQDVFLMFWCRPDRFDASRGSLRSYLVTQARHRAIDVFRNRAARGERERRSSLDRGDTYDLEHHILHALDAKRLVAALSGLPETTRRAIFLAFFAGHSYREVALLIDQPEGTVKSRVRKGLAELRTSLRVELEEGRADAERVARPMPR